MFNNDVFNQRILILILFAIINQSHPNNKAPATGGLFGSAPAPATGGLFGAGKYNCLTFFSHFLARHSHLSTNTYLLAPTQAAPFGSPAPATPFGAPAAAPTAFGAPGE